MKIFLQTLFFFLGLAGICLGEAPHQLGGFVLGEDIGKYTHKLRMDTRIPIRHLECMKEIETRKIEGFKSGLIYYGTCDNNQRIIRIKLKYEDSSAKFYEDLLRHYKKRFGEPDEWKGDPFHIVVAWKWYFTDKDHNKISMILQHNTQNTEEKMGNSVKLTMSNLMEAERACFKGKQQQKGIQKKERRHMRQSDWEKLMPR